MYRNYLKSTIRNFLKSKTFAIINLLGLCLGLSAFLIILQYVYQELSYDDFQSDKENIYRIAAEDWAAGPAGVGPDLYDNIPGIIDYVKLRRSFTALSYKNQTYKEDRVFYATQSFFKIISYDLIQGVDSLVLKEPYTMAISESIAQKYFKDEDPMGKIMTMNGYANFTVTGVYKDPTETTHMKIDVLYSFDTYVQIAGETAKNSWDWWGFYTYIKLEKGTDEGQFESKMAEFVEHKMGEELRADNDTLILNLQRIDEIHLNSNLAEEFEANGNGTIVFALIIVAFFIIVIAWLNYINLSTAKSMHRAKEIGIRKVMGSSKKQLITQFLLESILLNVVAVVIAIVVFFVVTPYFEYFTGSPLSINIFSDITILIGFPVLIIVGAFLSGLYPAFIVSNYQPIETLKGKLISSSKGQLLRKSIVIIQFLLSIVLIVCTFTIFKQINFLQNKDLGLAIDQTLILKGPNARDSTYTTKYRAFKTELLRHPAIESITTSSDVPGRSITTNNAGGVRRMGAPESDGLNYRLVDIDYDFVKAYEIDLVAGRSFEKERHTSLPPILMNESGIQFMGFQNPEEAIGQKIYFWGANREIVGVLKDYHQDSPKTEFQPIIYRPLWDDVSWQTYYSIKLNNNNVRETISILNSAFDHFFPGNAFSHFFLDDQYQSQYESDILLNKLFNFFSSLAIFIACLGLFSLSTFTVIQKMKEIGIRKVLGAKVHNIVFLISNEFMKLILIALIIGLPIGWYLMEIWLSDFAYRINSNWSSFLIPTLLLLFISSITIGFQIRKAAIANPVETMKYE